jgi:hypothetical protein
MGDAGAGALREIQLSLWNDTSGVVDAHNGITAGMASDASGSGFGAPRFQSLTGTASPTIGGVTVTTLSRPTFQQQAPSWEYVAIVIDSIATSGSAQAWLFGESGAPYRMGSVAITPSTFKWFGLYLSAGAGGGIQACDFMREDTKLPF